jgi:amino acid permease
MLNFLLFALTNELCRGFAMGWDYAIQWLTILPFEITAAGLTIDFWRPDINIGVWIAVFLTALCIIQIFGVRGYGEGERSNGCSPNDFILTAM